MGYYKDPIGHSENTEQEGKHGDGKSFLTEACVKYLLLTEDCEELTVLRKFRDEYVKQLPNGEALIKEYYDIARLIVNRINVLGVKPRYLIYMYLNIVRCVERIKSNENELALREYIDMVRYLKSEFKIIS